MTTALAEWPSAEPMSEPPHTNEEHLSELTLAALPSAVSCARMLVRQAVIRFQIGKEAAAAVEAITDVLVIHTVATAGITDPAPLYTDAGDRLRLLFLRLRFTADHVIVEVWDRGKLPPHPRLSQSPAIQAAREWGFDLPARGERVVWCVVPLAPDPREVQQAVLPRRVRRSVPNANGVAPAEAEQDVALLARVLDRLRRLGLDGGQDTC